MNIYSAFMKRAWTREAQMLLCANMELLDDASLQSPSN